MKKTKPCPICKAKGTKHHAYQSNGYQTHLRHKHPLEYQLARGCYPNLSPLDWPHGWEIGANLTSPFSDDNASRFSDGSPSLQMLNKRVEGLEGGFTDELGSRIQGYTMTEATFENEQGAKVYASYGGGQKRAVKWSGFRDAQGKLLSSQLEIDDCDPAHYRLSTDKAFDAQGRQIKGEMNLADVDPSQLVFSPIRQLMEIHYETCLAARELMKQKNHDHTDGSDDPFANFRAARARGVEPKLGLLIRVDDKLSRLTTFINKGTLRVENESANDAIIDVINYMILLKGMMLEEGRLQPTEVNE